MAVDVGVLEADRVEPVVVTDSGVWGVVRPVRSKDVPPMGKQPTGQDQVQTILAGVGAMTDDNDAALDPPDSSSRAGRAARQSRMTDAKRERMQRLSKFLREQRERAAMTQKELTTRARSRRDLTENVSTGLVPHLESLIGDALHASDVGYNKLSAILYSLGATHAELEDYLLQRQPERLSEQQEQERALLATFRALSPFARRTVIDQARYWLGVESVSPEQHLEALDERMRAARDAYDAEQDEHGNRHTSGA